MLICLLNMANYSTNFISFFLLFGCNVEKEGNYDV
jgi:hypothetical protein